MHTKTHFHIHIHIQTYLYLYILICVNMTGMAIDDRTDVERLRLSLERPQWTGVCDYVSLCNGRILSSICSCLCVWVCVHTKEKDLRCVQVRRALEVPWCARGWRDHHERLIHMSDEIHSHISHVHIHKIFTFTLHSSSTCVTWLVQMCNRQAYYGVATISRLLKMIGLFCRILSLLWVSFAKETYHFKEPTNRSHPIDICLSHIWNIHIHKKITHTVTFNKE